MEMHTYLLGLLSIKFNNRKKKMLPLLLTGIFCNLVALLVFTDPGMRSSQICHLLSIGSGLLPFQIPPHPGKLSLATAT